MSSPASPRFTCRGKFGEEVEAALGARLVGDLAAFSAADLVAQFGEQRGAFLAGLPLAQVCSFF